MADIIQVLPDSVANQIAAGEVIQRPASVVKELMENAVDAEATEVKVILKDAGKTSIQIVDNGLGMSDTDARLAFERHATSKIKQADDLFSIHTMGFRGEALASVAAIAHVDLKTRTSHDEIGTSLRIEGSRVIAHEPVQCPQGSNFIIKNLFYNVPARRKFLKKDTTELNNSIREFIRVALAYPQIAFTFIHNDHTLYQLNSQNFGQRIVGVYGKNMQENLIPVKSDTQIVKIRGYIGKPEKAKKRSGEQFFFVNSRYMRNPYLYKAIMNGYERLISQGAIPAYFLRFEIPAENIDVNIHPTKTEIKFEDNQAIWQILNASVRESLGKNNIVPSIDFDQKGNIGIPPMKKDKEVAPPKIEIDPTFNPFEQEGTSPGKHTPGSQKQRPDPSPANWESLYEDFEGENEQTTLRFTSKASHSGEEQEETLRDENRFFQFKQTYILTPVKSGLMVIHQQRAHVRILYEFFLHHTTQGGVIQKTLYPEEIQLSQEDYNICKELQADFKKSGFEMEVRGDQTLVLHGFPSEIKVSDGKELIEQFISEYQKNHSLSESVQESVALGLAHASSITSGQSLEISEMRELVDKLFACSAPNYTPKGEKIISLIETEDLEKLF